MDSLYIVVTTLRIVGTLIGYLTLGLWTLGKFDMGTFVYYFRLG